MNNSLTKIETWEGVINDAMPRFNNIAKTHKLVRWQEECNFALQSVIKNKELQKCAPFTVQDAITNVASVGLTLNPADSYAYLVPNYNSVLGQNECQLRISFKGLLKVAADSGAIQWVKADVVKQNDTFTEKGIGIIPEHVKDSFGERGETVGVYCVAKLNTGEYLTEIMSLAEIEKIRKCAKFDAIWSQWFDEMAKKAVIKRASKQWIKSGTHSTLNAAVSVLNETEGSDPDYMIFTPEQEEAFNKAVENENPLEYMKVCENIAGGSSSTPSANSEIIAQLVAAYKEKFRESKQMTEKGDLIKNLSSEASLLFREQREEVLAQVEDNNIEAVEELFQEYDGYGLRRKLWDSFSENEQNSIQELKNQ